MRLSILAVVMFGGVLAGATAPVRAQSLAEVAKKEEARRKATKDGAKVYTNKDLGAAADAGVPAAPAPTTSAAANDAKDAAATKAATDAKQTKTADPNSATKGSGSDDKKPAADQASWSKRMAGLRETLQRDQVYAEALQSRINALTTDFVNRDDPAQRGQIGSQRETAMNELNRLKKQIEDDKKAIADAEEEARRSGVPAGWLR
jgi:hypothetical protein